MGMSPRGNPETDKAFVVAVRKMNLKITSSHSHIKTSPNPHPHRRGDPRVVALCGKHLNVFL
jgi:hypothetical protein